MTDRTTKTKGKAAAKPKASATSKPKAAAGAHAGETLRGVALIQKAIEAASSGAVKKPKPANPALLDRLVLPNDEPLTPSMRALLAFDTSFLGMEIDEEAGQFETMSLDELIEREFGEEWVGPFGEACDILGDDCILIDGGSDSRRFLYVGNADSAGEYPVITIDMDEMPWVGGFVPFNVWVAQRLGALESEKVYGWVPKGYEAAKKQLARLNGDGRVEFESKESDDEDDDDDDDDDADDEG